MNDKSGHIGVIEYVDGRSPLTASKSIVQATDLKRNSHTDDKAMVLKDGAAIEQAISGKL